MWDSHPLSLTLEFERSLDLVRTMAHGRMGSADPCLRVLGNNVWRATRTPVGLATERLTLVDRRTVQVDAWGPGAGWLLEHAPALCGRQDTPESFCPEQPLLRELAHRHPGLRMGRSDAVFETGLFVTLEQRVATREAWHSWQRLVRALGEPAPGPLPGLYAPPSPERLARTPTFVFHRFGVEARRADIIRRMAVVAGRLEETIGMTLEAAYARLRAIGGVGPWSAARVAMLALGDPDAVFIGDLHLPHLVSSALAGERLGSDERMLELLEPYRGHRARVVRLLIAASSSRAQFPVR